MQLESPTLTFTESDVILRRPGRSVPIVARVLGREIRDDLEIIYLDRRVHREDESAFADGWSVSGAIASILVRESARVD